MKKARILVTSGIITVSMTTSMLAIEYIDQAAADADAERQRQNAQAINDNMEKGKTDDAALKKAIISLFSTIICNTDFEPITYIMEDMNRHGIPRERQIKGLENIIHEMLSAVEKDEKIDDPHLIQEFIAILEKIPEHNILPIIKDCLNSRNEIIRTGAMKRYNIITEKLQEQPTPKNDTAKKDEIIITGDNGANKFSTPAMTNVTDEKGEPSQQTPPIPPEKPSSNKIILLFSIITLLAVIGGVVAWRKKP